MALVLLLLSGAAVVAATSYSDYSGGRMPQYGIGVNDYEGPQDSKNSLDEYHSHSPDYRHDDESQYKIMTQSRNIDDNDSWQNPERRHRAKKRPQQTGEYESKYERENLLSSLRTSRRHMKHRSRLKGDEQFSDKKVLSEISPKYGRDKYEDSSDNIYIDKDDFSDDKSKDFDETSKFDKSQKSRRLIKRKPRARILKENDKKTGQNKMQGSYEEITDELDDLDNGKRLRDDDDFALPFANFSQDDHPRKYLSDLRNSPRTILPEKNSDSPDILEEAPTSDVESGRDFPKIGIQEADRDAREDVIALGRHAPVQDYTVKRYRPIAPRKWGAANNNDDDDNESITRTSLKTFYDFENYYDMKRINGQKTKLPMLTRRTMGTSVPNNGQVMAADASDTRYYDYSKAMQDAQKTPKYSKKDLSIKLRPTIRRRLYNRPTKTSLSTFHNISTTLTDNTITFAIIKPHERARGEIQLSKIPFPSPSLPNIPFLPSNISAFFGSTVVGITDFIEDLEVTKKINVAYEDHEAKADWKDKSIGKKTEKPPVLLEVSKQVPTVVMLEPPGFKGYGKDTVVSKDTPERIEKVKKLFRHKLLVRAKDIKDLANDWDSLVCDYIDMDLLANSAQSYRVLPTSYYTTSVFDPFYKLYLSYVGIVVIIFVPH